MVLDKTRVGWLLIAWAFFMVLALSMPIIIPLVLMIIGTILYLI